MNKLCCYNCKYGRRAGAPNMVACAYVFKKYEMDYQKIIEDLDIDSLNTGWGYIKRAVNDEKGGTIGLGLMTNNVAIFNKDFCCKYGKLND